MTTDIGAFAQGIFGQEYTAEAVLADRSTHRLRIAVGRQKKSHSMHIGALVIGVASQISP
ncbi:hypothetical protein [Streptomyces sp. NPDC007088]|uniref:hypothetical protein n=1 Tax=Streptomyces sp. NPDC007088 TaxID=3364773 RepID=UPI00368B7EB1